MFRRDFMIGFTSAWYLRTTNDLVFHRFAENSQSRASLNWTTKKGRIELLADFLRRKLFLTGTLPLSKQQLRNDGVAL